MGVFRNASIRTKITALTMLMGLSLLVLATGAFVWSEISSFRRGLVAELTTLSDVVGTNSTGAISFGDQQLAEQTLGALRAVPRLLSAEIYTPDGQLFARYPATPSGEKAPTAQESSSPQVKTRQGLVAGAFFSDDELELVRPITLDSDLIGMTVLRSDLGELYARLRWYTLIVAGVLVSGIVIAFLLSGILQRMIAEPIIRLAEVTGIISREKKYTVRVEKHGSDEIGRLVDGFNEMLGQIQTRDEQLQQQRQQLESQLAALQSGAQTLGSSLDQLGRFLTDLTVSSSETASSVSQTATTVEEVKQTAYRAHRQAQEISEGSQQTAHVAKAGESSVEEAIEGMQRVRDRLGDIAQSVLKVGEQNQAISEITVTVSDLAEQSNLLAINAAIEAAKAGQAGKGFGVVAQEVRNLAEQSKRATAQIHTILSDTQRAVNAAVLVTEQGTKAAELGVHQSLQAGESIRVLAKNITEAAKTMGQIATSSQQQLLGMDQVASAMESIRKITNHNVNGIRQLETTARNLQHVGQTLAGLLQQQNIYPTGNP